MSMEAVRTPRERLFRFFRRHPEAVVFAIGFLLFVFGLLSVFTNLFEGDDPVAALNRERAEEQAKPKATGPEPGASIVSYIESRRQVLRERSSRTPKEASFAVVSFDSYKKADDARQLLIDQKVDALELHIRIPLPGFLPEKVELGSRSIPEGLAERIGPTRIATLQEELRSIEQIIPTVNDKEFKAVYEADAKTRREAIQLLRSNPSVIYGVVVKASYSNLAALAAAPGVRLVDVPDQGEVDLSTHSFVSILPEETETATGGA